ncbi:DDE transposase family protein [Lyngbya aestuarii]|uniref:DDE transposase family protein n=1 Tax=Lyngbya aestuarii TaxID=118322 RepID=UPI00403E12D3
MVYQNSSETWYIVKRQEGHCEIVSSGQAQNPSVASDVVERWGPFDSQQEAIARRVGLIRAGKCQPM